MSNHPYDQQAVATSRAIQVNAYARLLVVMAGIYIALVLLPHVCAWLDRLTS